MSLRTLWGLYTVAVLFGLLAFQSVWFVGTTTLRDFGSMQKLVQQYQDDKSRISAAAGPDGISNSAKSLIEPIQKKIEALEPQMSSAVSAIKTWNPMWRWIIFWSPHSTSDSSEDENGELRSANSANQILGLYILPLFYGWLGALLWVVQKLREDGSADAIDNLRPGARVVTGMVAGPMIGMFLSPEFLNSLAFQATPFLVAFLGGYSTDVFFSLLDRFLRVFRDALEKPATDGSGAAKSANLSTSTAAVQKSPDPPANPGS